MAGPHRLRQTSTASWQTGRSWPVRIDKNLGLPPLMVFGPFAVVAALHLVPQLLSGLSLQYVLFHTSSGGIQLGIAIALALLCLATRRRGQLTLDTAGVDVQIGAKGWFYDWADIEHLDEVKGGVKISLHGRTAEQNQYNIINARFTGDAGELRQLLSEGQTRFAPGRRSSGRTVAPGDDLRRARLQGGSLALAIVAAPMVLVLVPVAIWAARDCAKTLDLQTHGMRTEATVTRIYTDGCGRSSCSIYAQFNFLADGRTFDGHGYLASDRNPDDPDLIYVKTRGTVPVAYDVRRPVVVDLNFRDWVFRRNAYALMWQMIGLIGVIMGGITLLMSLAVLPTLLRALRTPRGGREPGEPAKR